MAIITNYLVSDPTKKISLKGNDGQNHEGPAKNPDSDHLNGKDGAPGKPGQTSGSFFVKIMSDMDMKNIRLNIDVNGSRGGDGQQGGDGADGRSIDVSKIDEDNLRLIELREDRHII